MSTLPVSLSTGGPNRAYTPQLEGPDGTRTPSWDVKPVVVAEGTGGAALALESGGNLAAIRALLQAQLELADLFVTDGTSFFVREVTLAEGTGARTVTFLNLDGTVPNPAPNAANLKPVGATSIAPEVTYFDVVTAAAGYAVGDVLARVLFVNTATQAIAGSAWQNVTQAAVLASAPVSTNIVEQARNVALAAGAAQDGADATGVTPPAGASGIRGWLSGIYALLKGTLSTAVFTPVKGATVALIADATATRTSVPLAAVTASTYRARNAATSASLVAWRLSTSSNDPAVLAVPYGASGVGGASGDKILEPGQAATFGLSANQQAALAAGTLCLSAITPSNGSATLYITPGSGA